MGTCMSKGEPVDHLAYSTNTSGAESVVEPASLTSRANNTRVSNQELSTFNLFFDEWGAMFLDSSTGRWHVNIHNMPETNTISSQEVDRGNISQIFGQAQLYSREVYGSLPFSSYLPSPLKDTQASCPPPTAPFPNLPNSGELPADYPDKASHTFLEIDKNVLSADSLLQWSEKLKPTFKNVHGDSWRCAQTVKSARRPLSSEGMVSFNRKDCSNEGYLETECARDSSVEMSNETMSTSLATAVGAGEIGVFEAEKYFKANDQHKIDQEPCLTATYIRDSGPAVIDRTTSATSSVRVSEAQDAVSFYQDYRNSTAASSDVSYDSRSALSGARKLASSSDAMWSSSPNDSKSNRRSKSKPARPTHHKNRSVSSIGCRWLCCSSSRALDTLDEGSYGVSRRPQRHSNVKVQDIVMNDSLCSQPIDADLTALSKETALPVLRKCGSETMHELPQPLSSSQRLMNLFGKPKTGSCKSLSIIHPQRTASMQHQNGWFLEGSLKEHVENGMSPLPMPSEGKRQQSKISGVHHGQLPNGLHAPHLSNAESYIETSDGYTHITAQVQKRVDSILSPLQVPSVWQHRECMEPSSFQLMPSVPLPQTRADDIASHRDMARRNIPPMTPSTTSALPRQVAHQTWIMNRRAEISECSLLEDSTLSIIAYPWHAEEETAAPLTPCLEVLVKNETFEDDDHEQEQLVHHICNMQARDSMIQKQSECFTFPHIGCLPSANLCENGHSSIANGNEEQGISNLFKVHSFEEMKHLQDFLVGATAWDKGCEELKILEKESRSSSLSGGSTPTCSSGGLGSAFGSPFSVAVSCRSSDYQSQDEFAMQLGHYSQQRHGCEQMSYNFLDDYGMTRSSLFNKNSDENQQIHDHMATSNYLPGVTLNDGDDNDEDDDGREAMCFHEHTDMHAQGKSAICIEEELVWSKEEYQEMDSDSSSDLFDLDSLPGRNKMERAADRSLPVFEMPSFLLRSVR